MTTSPTPHHVASRPDTGAAGDRHAPWVASMVQAYERGDSIRAIAQVTGRGYGTVRQMLIDAGVKLRRRGGALDAELVARVSTAYTAGSSMRAIATKEHRDDSTIHTILTNAGVKIRPAGRSRSTADLKKARKAVTAYNASDSVSTIAARLGHSPTTVYRYLAEAGVALRQRGSVHHHRPGHTGPRTTPATATPKESRR